MSSPIQTTDAGDEGSETDATCETHSRWAFCQTTRSRWTFGLGVLALIVVVLLLA